MRARGVATVAVLVLGACANFADVSTIVDLRVLAISTDPSEVVLTVTGLPTDPTAPVDPRALAIDPASIPTIHLTPLVVDPPAETAGRPVTYDLVACPNDPYGAAPPANAGGGGPDPSGGARTTVGSSMCDPASATTWPLGTNLTVASTFDVTLTAAQLLAAFQKDVYLDQNGNPHGGFDLGMPLNLQLTLHDGVSTLVALKRVLFWPRRLMGVDAAGNVVVQRENVEPTIPSVETYADRTESWDPLGPVTTLAAGTPPGIHVAVGGFLWLQPLKREGGADGMQDLDAEEYVTTVISRDPPYDAIPDVVPRERLRYAFFTTAGHFDPVRTVNELIPGVTGTIHLESRYVAPPTLDQVPVDASGAHVVRVWIVVRDDRGGEAWVERALVLDPAP